MSWEHGNCGVNTRHERTLFSDEEIGVVPDSPPDIGEGLIVGMEHLYEIIKGAEGYPFIVSSTPKIAERKEKRKGNKEEKKTGCVIMLSYANILPLFTTDLM